MVIRTPALMGAFTIVLFFGILGGWAALAPLESAAIASGVVSVDTKRKTLQHLEGGIVKEILVGEGDRVQVGNVLIRVDETQPRANLALVQGRRRATLAVQARLIAERDAQAEVTFPPELIALRDLREIRSQMSGQLNIFHARRKSLQGQKAILEQRVAQFEAEIRGLQGQMKAQDRQIDLIRDQEAGLKKLFKKGMSGKSQLRELQRELAEVSGERSKAEAAIARARQNIAEARLNMTELKTRFLNAVLQELDDVQSELFDLTEKARAAEDVLRRTVIRAPLDGTVVSLGVHTVGGVIAPGERLLDIVPRDERLVIEARVEPKDIDVVEPGLTAQVRLTAFSQRNTLPVMGRVLTISADRLTDERSGEDYFLARVELLDDVGSLPNGTALYPGMHAEVMIVTEARTLLDYLFRPMAQSFNRAFRES
jgi:HlyD family type I secretion membrane fusion protein